MKISRYLDADDFRREADKLKVTSGFLSANVLERLEKQRSLIPRLRLHYPDEIERRWFAENHPEEIAAGLLEPDGERWTDANDLEKARHRREQWDVDPSVTPHVLDGPAARFLQFIEKPFERDFVPWESYRVAAFIRDDEPIYDNDTAVTYYSSWQLLQFAEVVNMGVVSYINLFDCDDRPSKEQITNAPQSMSFMPMHAMRGFREHASALDAIIWFSEEADLGDIYATHKTSGRRLISEDERKEIERIKLWAMKETQERHDIDAAKLLAAVRFLCEQWAQWTGEGRPLIADAYKTIAMRGIKLGRLITSTSFSEYRDLVGHAGGYFKPILDVMWPDWAAEQRETAKRLLVGYRRDRALLKADFSDDLVDRFLDFIEDKNLHGFYWRLESFHHHAFKGNGFALEGLKGDVQGMAVVLEHIASALGSSRTQLSDKFKQLWAGEPAVLKLLKDNATMKIGNGQTIDLDWFAIRDGLSLPEQTAADLAICYAIRGGAHRVIEESNPLKLERMMLIMLRAAVKTFDAAMKERHQVVTVSGERPE